ncbi:thiamine pyrophosphate-dependent enzyme [Aquimarina sp. AU58]|uniref:thiamine pyrophosphate-dependent enzyme n=1 Tax=Aquimarina sp. AU58 TaxID=1874112 RepID=UPI000D645047|nr:thiamine pyrophosphate-dependent enzyme [Aquimarina sp. AU58]
MAKLTGGQIVVRSLIKQGITIVFGLPGVQNDWLYNAFYDYQDEIKIIHTRHEQGVGYMALGYHLASGKTAVYNVVPGPGFLNSSAALLTAYGLNAKVLALVGQTPLKTQGKGWGVLHESNDQLGIMKRLTKYSDKVNDIKEIPYKIQKSFQEIETGRPQPVGLEISMDLLMSSGEIAFPDFAKAKQEKEIDTPTINKIVEVLIHAKNPLIFVGSGAMDASKEITALANYMQIPVFAYRTGKGIVSSRNYLSHPVPAAYELWKEADVVVGIGSHVRMPILKWGTDEHLSFISVNIDANDHDKITTPDIALTANAAQASKEILETLKNKISQRASREKEMQALKASWKEKTAYLEPQATYLRIIREELPDDGIFVDELTQVGFASRMLWEAYAPRTYLSTGYMGTLGWGFPTALGAKVARPELPVVTVCGDGGFMFAVQELATAVQHRIGVIICLFNNNAYGNVQNMQVNNYGNKVIASDLTNPDFIAMAKSYGAHAEKVSDFDSFRLAIQKAKEQELPTLIEIEVGIDMPSTDQFKSMSKLRGVK